jgi:hypothetical protein
MAFQVGQNISDTVSPLDKLLLERQEECWLMLNNTYTTSAMTTAGQGKVLELKDFHTADYKGPHVLRETQAGIPSRSWDGCCVDF